MLVYTALRLLLFAVPFLLLMAFGVELVWALLIAALASSFASIFVLGRFRDQLSVSLSERKERIQQRMVEREQAEDQWDDDQRAATESDSSVAEPVALEQDEPDQSAGNNHS